MLYFNFLIAKLVLKMLCLFTIKVFSDICIKYWFTKISTVYLGQTQLSITNEKYTNCIEIIKSNKILTTTKPKIQIIFLQNLYY